MGSASLRYLMEARMRSAFLLPLFTVAISFAQSPSQDMQVIQALLAEIRLLRQDLQATAVVREHQRTRDAALVRGTSGTWIQNAHDATEWHNCLPSASSGRCNGR